MNAHGGHQDTPHCSTWRCSSASLFERKSVEFISIKLDESLSVCNGVAVGSRAAAGPCRCVRTGKALLWQVVSGAYESHPLTARNRRAGIKNGAQEQLWLSGSSNQCLRVHTRFGCLSLIV